MVLSWVGSIKVVKNDYREIVDRVNRRKYIVVMNGLHKFETPTCTLLLDNVSVVVV